MLRPMAKTFCCGWLLLLGCGGESEQTAATPNTTESVNEVARAAQTRIDEAAAQPPTTQVDPCSVLTEATVRRALSVAADVVIETRRGTAAQNVCTYIWPNPGFDEEAQNREMVRRMQKAMGEGGDARRLLEAASAARSGNQVSYTHMPTLASAELARSTFTTSMARMNERIAKMIERGPATTVAVVGLGDAAQWSPRMHQLSLVHGNRILHVMAQVGDDDDDDLTAAKRLALALIAN